MIDGLYIMLGIMTGVIIVIFMATYDRKKESDRIHAKQWDKVRAEHMCKKLTGVNSTTDDECAPICKTMHQRLGRKCAETDESGMFVVLDKDEKFLAKCVYYPAVNDAWKIQTCLKGADCSFGVLYYMNDVFYYNNAKDAEDAEIRLHGYPNVKVSSMRHLFEEVQLQESLLEKYSA